MSWVTWKYRLDKRGLINTKLHAHGLSKNSMSNLLNNHWERVKQHKIFNSSKKLRKGVQHGSTLGPLLSHTYIDALIFTLLVVDISYFVNDSS